MYRSIQSVLFTIVLGCLSVVVLLMCWSDNNWQILERLKLPQAPAPRLYFYSWENDVNTRLADVTADSTKVGDPRDVCFPSPYVDCSECTKPGCVVSEIYFHNFGRHRDLKIDPDFDALPPGLTAFRVDDIIDAEFNRTLSLSGTGNNSKPSGPGRNRTFRVKGWREPSFSGCHFNNCVSAAVGEADIEMDAIVINGVNMDLQDPGPRREHQVFVMEAWESPVHYHNGLMHSDAKMSWNHMFNLTQTFRRDSDIFQPYGRLKYTRSPPAINITDIISRKRRTAFWIVSNCKSPSKRRDYIKEMQRYIDVDIYGECGDFPDCYKGHGEFHAGCRPSNWNFDDYHFYLAFENSLCTDYITEKFFKTFAENRTAVPVVRGGALYDSFFHPGSFVNAARFTGARDLALHLKRLSSRDNVMGEYAELLKTKFRYVPASSPSTACRLCEFLNKRDANVRRFYNIQKYVDLGSCHAPTDL